MAAGGEGPSTLSSWAAAALPTERRTACRTQRHGAPCWRPRAPASRAPSAGKTSRPGWAARCRWRLDRTGSAGGGKGSRARQAASTTGLGRAARGLSRAGASGAREQLLQESQRPRTSAPCSAAQRAPSGNHWSQQMSTPGCGAVGMGRPGGSGISRASRHAAGTLPAAAAAVHEHRTLSHTHCRAHQCLRSGCGTPGSRCLQG